MATLLDDLAPKEDRLANVRTCYTIDIIATDIELAQGTTEEALSQLREARSAQISSIGNDSDFQMALENYEYVLTEEITLRSIAPGIPVPNAPNDPSIREGDVAAVKNFLNMEFSNDGHLQSIE
eukprot:scaffold2351_cov254-Chaetoceros_neogracile.AAC.12